MSQVFYELKCLRCGKIQPASSTSTSCPNCGGELEVVWDLEAAKNSFQKGKELWRYGIWSYDALIPVNDVVNSKATLSEGGTPLIRSKHLSEILGLKNLYLKDETRNPTGSFKDRSISVGISKAKEFKIKDVVCASTGNLAASVSAYSAVAGINAHIFMPNNVPKSKIVQTAAYGASVHLVEGVTTDDASVAALEASKKTGWFLMRSNPKWNPYPLEGAKTIAFEIAEQLDWAAPDFLLTGVGSGTNLAANGKGFHEFQVFGLINKIPKLVGVQASGCMPFVDAILRNLPDSEVKPWKNPKTIASGLADAYPPALTQASKAVHESKGTAVAVDDDEFVSAALDLAKYEAIYAEPSGAASIAAVKHLISDHTTDKSDVVVCEITGSGFKQPYEMEEALRSHKAW